MSKILKKSLSLVLAFALCVTAMIGCFGVSAADDDATATYKITFGTVSNGQVSATLNVTSTASDLAALQITLDLPGLPVKAMSTDSVYDLSTYPEGSLPLNNLEQIRVLLVSKNNSANYNYANFTITFDCSASALVNAGIDPDAGANVSITVRNFAAAGYGTGLDGLEGNTKTAVAANATKDSLGRAASTVRVVATCAHSYTSVVTQAATCTATGVRHYTCTICGREYDEDIAVTPHSWDAGTVTVEAKCTTAGEKVYTCTVCGATRSEAIAATGRHTYVTPYDANPAHYFIQEGDCTSEGYADPICQVCQNRDSTQRISLGYGEHDWDVTELVPVSCTQDGQVYKVCNACFEEDYETIPATGHAWNAGVVTTQPTCVPGVKTYTCTTCGETTTEDIPAVSEHSWDAGVVTTQPTTTSTGVKTYTCTVCGATTTEEIPQITAACTHATLAAPAYEANTGGTYDAVVRCADCGEVITRIATDIPAATSVNTAITANRMAYVSDTLGVGYITTNSQLSGYATYTLRVYRQTCDANYNFVSQSAGEFNSFARVNSKTKLVTYTGLALYELNLPVVGVICGYNAAGQLVAVSSPFVDYPVDLIWNTYNVGTATQVYKTCCVDLVNLASESQLYFAKEGSDLAGVVLPRNKFAFNQSDATQETPTYDLSTMPNSIDKNASSSISTTTYGLIQNLSLATGSPAVSYMVKKGKNLDRSLLVLNVSYESATGTISKTVVGNEATETTDAWSLYSSYAYYSFSSCKLYDTNKTVTATFTYNGTEMYTSVYSVETFIAQNYTDASMGATLVAMGKFGNSARAYFGVA